MDGVPPGSIVHLSNWAQQPDVYLACERWTTPSWSQMDGLPACVYQEEGGELYTFERDDLVNCVECLRRLKSEGPV